MRIGTQTSMTGGIGPPENRFVVLPILHVWAVKTSLQDIVPIREMLKGQRAIDAGVVYLQDEEYKFKAREGGREWSVYGSPVRTTISESVQLSVILC